MSEQVLNEIQEVITRSNKGKYSRQKKQLLSLVNETEGLEELFKELGCFVAGGAVTSVFTNKEVHDLDIYFRDKESLLKFIKVAFSDAPCVPCTPINFNQDVTPSSTSVILDTFSLRYVGHTDKSVMFLDGSGMQVEAIHCGFYPTVEDIFKSFDFTINMGVYDFAQECFVLDEDFLTDNASRKLRVNEGTSFPIISQLRLAKYQQRGYSINRKEFIKLCLSVASLNLSSWDDVKNAIGGMYGYNMDDLFDEDKDFTMEEVFEQLEELECNLEGTTAKIPATDLEDLLEFIEEQHKANDPDKEYFYYKKVLKTSEDGVYTSIYKRDFKYIVGESPDNSGNGIYLYKSVDKAKNHYLNYDSNDGAVIIKLTSGKTRAKLQSDGGGKYSTCTKLTVVGEMDLEDI
ncbi:hypothetical protein [Pseudoalteromonas phage J2-1]|uniref:Uncharacterized protein n=1 Tax=Pseudoalteromonas phage J2-1 TaxID=2023998 RepID=A0A223LHF0_9CAUD|nr:hypothetical protein HOR90_gp16 [Pseudoalteromonas phage J2-1]ASU03303.1 hypothetical protein [Pseudoalteromonas phage J2-1]